MLEPAPRRTTEIGAALDELIAAGHVAPIVGARFPLERAGDALKLIDDARRDRQGRAGRR